MNKFFVVSSALMVGTFAAGCAAEAGPETVDPDAEEITGTATSALTTGIGNRLEIKSAYTAKCIDLPNGWTAAGTAVNQFSCHRADNQQFFLNQVTFGGQFTIVSKKAPTMCVGVTGVRAPDNTPLVLVPCRDANGDVPLGARWYLDNKVDTNATTSQVTFRAAAVPGPTRAGACIDVPGGWNINSLQLQTFRCHGGPNQRWTVTNF